MPVLAEPVSLKTLLLSKKNQFTLLLALLAECMTWSVEIISVSLQLTLYFHRFTICNRGFIKCQTLGKLSIWKDMTISRKGFLIKKFSSKSFACLWRPVAQWLNHYWKPWCNQPDLRFQIVYRVWKQIESWLPLQTHGYQIFLALPGFVLGYNFWVSWEATCQAAYSLGK